MESVGLYSEDRETRRIGYFSRILIPVSFCCNYSIVSTYSQYRVIFYEYLTASALRAVATYNQNVTVSRGSCRLVCRTLNFELNRAQVSVNSPKSVDLDRIRES